MKTKFFESNTEGYLNKNNKLSTAEISVTIAHGFPSVGKSSPFDTHSEKDAINVSTTTHLNCDVFLIEFGNTIIAKFDVECFNGKVDITPGEEGTDAFDAKLNVLDNGNESIKKWAHGLSNDDTKEILVFIVVNRTGSSPTKFIKGSHIIHPKEYSEEYLTKTGRMDLLDHFTLEQMNEWISPNSIHAYRVFYDLKNDDIYTTTKDDFLNHIIARERTIFNDEASSEDNEEDDTLSDSKIIPIEICKSYGSECSIIESATMDPKLSYTTKLSTIAKLNCPDGSRVLPINMKSKIKSNSLTSSDITLIMNRVRTFFSASFKNDLMAINSSNNSIYVVLDDINLSVVSDKVVRIANSARISSGYDDNNAEAYRVNFARKAHYTTDKYTLFNSTLFDHLIRSKSVNNKLSFDLSYTENFIGNSNDDDSNDDPDGGSDIDKEEVTFDNNFEFKFITCEGDPEITLLNNMSDSFIDLNDVLSKDQIDELLFVDDDSKRSNEVFKLLDSHINENYENSAGNMFIIFSTEWWMTLGIKADIALGRTNNGSLEGHPLPIVTYSEGEPLSEEALLKILHNGVSEVVVDNEVEDEDSVDNSSRQRLFENESNSWMTAFNSVDSAIIGDNEKLTGLCIKCSSQSFNENDSNNSIIYDNTISIARLYKRVTVVMVENNTDININATVRNNNRNDFVDICSRIDQSKIEFSNSFHSNKGARLRKADEEHVLVSPEFDDAFANDNSDAKTCKYLTYSVVSKFLPYIHEVLTSTKNIHPRFNSENFNYMEGGEAGSIGVSFNYVFFSNLSAVIFYNVLNSNDSKSTLGSFFIITNISREQFFSNVLNDKNEFLSRSPSDALKDKSSINGKFLNNTPSENVDIVTNLVHTKFDRGLINGKFAGRNKLTSYYNNHNVPTVNANEVEHNILGNNTLVFGFSIDGKSFIIADTRTSSGSFINTDANTEKITTIKTMSGESFSFGCAGRVSDIQFTGRIIKDIVADMGDKWNFDEFKEHLCDFIYHMDKSERWLNIEILLMHGNNIVHVLGDGAAINYASTGYHCIGSGMLFILPAINVLFNNGVENVTLEKIVSIFLTASKFDSGISTTYVINEIGDETIQMLSYEQAPLDNFVPYILNGPKKTENKDNQNEE